MPKPSEARELRERGILLATAGLVFALVVGLGLGLTGLVTFRFHAWYFALGATLLVQFFLWLIPRRGWDRHLSWDPHYLYVPMVGAIGLLNLYALILPEAHDLLLMAWFVALVFMAGIATLREVVILSGLMAATHLAVVFLGPETVMEASVRFEMVKVAVFFGICVYAAFVFRRLRRQRLEMRRLRHELAEIFRENLRGSDVAARYGGEEFAFLLIETPIDQAWEVMERVRGTVAAHPFAEEEIQPSGELTISVGIAADRRGGGSMDELIERADRAIYAAKEAGRNRVHLAA